MPFSLPPVQKRPWQFGSLGQALFIIALQIFSNLDGQSDSNISGLCEERLNDTPVRWYHLIPAAPALSRSCRCQMIPVKHSSDTFVIAQLSSRWFHQLERKSFGPVLL